MDLAWLCGWEMDGSSSLSNPVAVFGDVEPAFYEIDNSRLNVFNVSLQRLWLLHED